MVIQIRVGVDQVFDAGFLELWELPRGMPTSRCSTRDWNEPAKSADKAELLEQPGRGTKVLESVAEPNKSMLATSARFLKIMQ